MIEVKNLTKYYGTKSAISDISFSVQDGEILGFLGPNGAGKSTTMNIITGYIGASDGTVTIDGDEIFESPAKVKAKIGYLPEQPPLYPDMTVAEYLSFIFDLKKLKILKDDHIASVCHRVGVADVTSRLIKNLSKGYKQRVGLAAALLGDPAVLILDEPTVGLDPNQIIEIRNLIKDLGKEHTVILSSHILPEIQATCDRIIVISGGKIIADDSTDHLAQSLGSDRNITLRVAGGESEISQLLSAIPGVADVSPLGSHEKDTFDFTVVPAPENDVRRAVFSTLADKKLPILLMRGNEMSLEEIFLKLTGGSSHTDPQDSRETENPEPPETLPQQNGGEE